jgi:cobalt/nickel transport system permease protein
MVDALLSPAVGGAMCVVSAAAGAYSVAKIKKDDLSEKKIPIMAIMGAFVFAAQMINFTIPGTGSSGHIGGGILLAGMLGGFPAFLSICAVLIIQCLFFADGGLLALGCNIFNMGVIPCLIIYPILFKPFVKNGFTVSKINIASVVSVIVGLQLGAFAVVLETQASGITELPFATFAALMQPIHLAIGIGEGIITAIVLTFVYKIRPEILENATEGKLIEQTVSLKKVLVSLTIVTLVTGGLLSLFASAYPDGLEWAMEKTAGTAELEVKETLLESAAKIQEATAFMPDYDFKDSEEGSIIGTSVAGILGGSIVFLIAGATGLLISTIKKSKKKRGEG